MEDRIFTEKDLTGLSRALQTMVRHASGQRTTIGKLLPEVQTALAAGITVDELLNPANYQRAVEDTGATDVHGFVTALVRDEITVGGLKEEEGWDSVASVQLLAEMVHDFYAEICPTGGVWSTAAAKRNLEDALRPSDCSLQGLLSEELIRKVEEETGKGEDLTCFQFVSFVRQRTISMTADKAGFIASNVLSREQREKREIEASSLEDGKDAGGETENTEEKSEDTNEEGTADKSLSEADDNTDNVYSEEEEESWDEDGYIPEDWPNMNDRNELDGQKSNFIAPSPAEYKRSQIEEALKGLQLSELTSLLGAFPKTMYTDEFISALADGKLEPRNESPELRLARQLLNGLLFQSFINCARWQGSDIDEETAGRLDLLTINWDLRDPRTRRLQKIKDLVFRTCGENGDDPDLLAAVSDLEKCYSTKQ